MRKYVTCLCMVAALIGCLGCARSEHTSDRRGTEPAARAQPCAGTPAAAQRAKWTIMLYMNGDNDLEPFALLDFAEMAEVKDNPDVNVIIQLDRKDGRDTDEDWAETRRFRMREGLTPTRTNALPGFDQEQNMGAQATLADFTAWAKCSFPAERYMLIIWDHGDGWRFVDRVALAGDAETAAMARARAVSAAEALLEQGRLTEQFLYANRLEQTPIGAQSRTVSEDETDRDRLFVREVQDALESVFRGGERLELLGFDACLMQMIEVGYAVRRVANVLVGSEELEPLEGWGYNDWLKLLVADPNMNGRALGRILVASYKRTYEKSTPATTLSALDLTENRAETLATAVTAFADELQANLSTERDTIVDARRQCRNYAPSRFYHGIDLHRFCSLIAAADVSPSLRARARAVTQLIDAMVIDNYAGSRRRGNFGSNGVAIYFPFNNEAYQSDQFKAAYRDDNLEFPVQFVQDHRWDNFLHAYFRLV